MDFQARTEALIETWHGITLPNDAGRRFAADLVQSIAAFTALRGFRRHCLTCTGDDGSGHCPANASGRVAFG